MLGNHRRWLLVLGVNIVEQVLHHICRMVQGKKDNIKVSGYWDQHSIPDSNAFCIRQFETMLGHAKCNAFITIHGCTVHASRKLKPAPVSKQKTWMARWHSKTLAQKTILQHVSLVLLVIVDSSLAQGHHGQLRDKIHSRLNVFLVSLCRLETAMRAAKMA